MAGGDPRAVWGRRIGPEVVRGRVLHVYRDRCRSLWELFTSVDASSRSEIALVHDGRRSSRADVDESVRRGAGRLAQLGIGPGERVGLLAANSDAWVVAFWSIVRVGAVPVLMNGWWSRDEVEHACALVEPRAVVVDETRRRLLPEHQRSVALESLAGPGDVTGADGSAVDEDSPGVIIFTSGTTGAPKAAVLAHRGVVARQQATMDISRRLPGDPVSAHRRVQLLATPLFHVGPLQQMISCWLTGSTLVLHGGRFDAGRVLDLIERERVTIWATVPTLLARLLAEADIDARDLTSLRTVSIGGAQVPDSLRDRIAQVLPGVGTRVTVGYGLTEAGGTVTSQRSLATTGSSCGPALPTVELRIAGPDEPVPGEVLVRSPTVMLGYHREPVQPIDDEGWLHTGDIGRLDPDGNLFIVDRVKDIIIRGGENVAAAHVESVLLRHPAVREVAVIGLPDDDLGEVVAAVVVTDRADLGADQLAAHARTALAHFEVPSTWWIRSEPLPTTSLSKVDKRSLRNGWPARETASSAVLPGPQ